MSRTTQSDHKDAQLRRTAVKRYRAGIPAAEVADNSTTAVAGSTNGFTIATNIPGLDSARRPAPLSVIPINSRPKASGALSACDNS